MSKPMPPQNPEWLQPNSGSVCLAKTALAYLTSQTYLRTLLLLLAKVQPVPIGKYPAMRMYLVLCNYIILQLETDVLSFFKGFKLLSPVLGAAGSTSVASGWSFRFKEPACATSGGCMDSSKECRVPALFAAA